MSLVLEVLRTALFLYFVLLIGRLVFEWVQVFARDWRPKGPVLVVAEAIYTATDPPLKALRRVIPPLRLGNVGIDLSFLVLMLGISVLMSIL
ncbi:MAG: YggT family protein [Actinobacteria bacterium]|uniref:YggT family protein n=1 Tax=Nostocoides veronense TaxID=330836 RepID=A0ABP4XMJ2_9MICO|nr:YggT family protein [Actinomycetota bacterium]